MCPVGKYFPMQGLTACLDCSALPGYWCAEGSIEAVLCPVGYWCPGGDADLLECESATAMGWGYCPRPEVTAEPTCMDPADPGCPAGPKMEPQMMGKIKEMNQSLQSSIEHFEKSEKKIRGWWERNGYEPEGDV